MRIKISDVVEFWQQQHSGSVLIEKFDFYSLKDTRYRLAFVDLDGRTYENQIGLPDFEGAKLQDILDTLDEIRKNSIEKLKETRDKQS